MRYTQLGATLLFPLALIGAGCGGSKSKSYPLDASVGSPDLVSVSQDTSAVSSDLATDSGDTAAAGADLATVALDSSLAGVADAPGAPLTISPIDLDFGTVTVGVTTSTHTITVTAQTDITIRGYGVSAGGIQIGIQTCYGVFLRAGDSCTMEVTLTAETSGQISGSIEIAVFGSKNTYGVPFTALAVPSDVIEVADGSGIGLDSGPWDARASNALE